MPYPSTYNIRNKNTANIKLCMQITDKSGTNIPLNGVVVYMAIKLLPSSEDTEFETNSQDDDIIIIDLENSLISVDIPASVVHSWTFTKAWYDIAIEWGADEIQDLLEGKITLTPGITIV